MRLTLRREVLAESCTHGSLLVDGVFEAFTLEDTVRTGPKVHGQTAIPAGRYRVDITLSARFGKSLPLLRDVPGFTGIRIHAGNTAADTEGCVLVGASRAHDSVLSSRLAMGHLQPLIAGALARKEEVWIDVHNLEGITA